MSSETQLREELRSPGPTCVTCSGCVFFNRCGGLQNGRPLLNCFDQFCCQAGDCDNVCPYKRDFQLRMHEISGFGTDDIGQLRQQPLQLPTYVPMIHHRSRRIGALSSSAVALDPYAIFRNRQGTYCSLARDGIELRRRLGVAAAATVILRGTAEDRLLEQFWTNRRIERVAEQIAGLGVSLVIGPNFSHFLDVPRTDILYNRKRQLLCLAEMSRCGVSVAPHLSATMPADWDFWADFLRNQPHVHHVALNLQTGNKNRTQGTIAIEQVHRIQNRVGRSLSVILIGGAQFIDLVTGRFKQFTLIDSEPFVKAMHRRVFRPDGYNRRWEESWSLERQPIDHILQNNVDSYAAWVEKRRLDILSKTTMN